MKKLLALAAITLGLGCATPVYAYGPVPGSGYGHGPGYRSAELHRIERAYARGALTARERHRLLEEHARLERLRRRAYADGIVTPAEARRIRQAEDALNRRITRESRDRQRRY